MHVSFKGGRLSQQSFTTGCYKQSFVVSAVIEVLLRAMGVVRGSRRPSPVAKIRQRIGQAVVAFLLNNIVKT